MKLFPLAAAVLTAGLVWGCATRAASRESADDNASRIGATSSSECGLLRWWHTPETDVVTRETDPPRHYATKAGLGLIAAAAERYCLTHGRYPASLDDLRKEALALPRGTRCRLDEAFLLDEWDTSIGYTTDRQGVPHLISSGPDRTQGTADDLSLPTLSDVEGQPLNGRVVCRL